MNRRIGREDLDGASPFIKETERHAMLLWGIYEDYDFVDTGDALIYFKAVGKPVDYYRPLVDAPRLFLDFARIEESKDPSKAVGEWVTEYGLLGLSHPEPGFVWKQTPEVVVPPLDYKDSGGPGDTAAAMMGQAKRTNRLLLLYEACLNQDIRALETLLDPSDVNRFSGSDPSGEENLEALWHEQNERASRDSRPGVCWVREMAGDMLVGLPEHIGWEGFLIDAALAKIWSDLVSMLNVFAYPALTLSGSPPLTTDRLVATWGARNLLGAMYLQFYWLITSGEDLSRCRHCNRIISHGPPAPDSKGRKPRKDKQFCDSRCRQNYHYHARIKPARQTKKP